MESTRIPVSLLLPLLILLALMNQSYAVRSASSAFVASTNRHKTQQRQQQEETPIVQQAQQIQERRAIPVWQLALAGGLATVVGDAVMHPIDCIKTIQQSDEGLYLSFVDAARLIWNDFGIGGFYKGLDVYASSDAAGGCVKFAAYEGLKAWNRRHVPEQYTTPVNYAAAGLAFLASSFILVPGEFMKQQIQMAHFSTVWEAAHSTFLNDGISGFFAGYDGCLLRDIPYTMVELGLYDQIKGMYMKSGSKTRLSPLEEICAAAITGGVAGYFTTPLDTIKTKLMVDQYEGGFLSCLLATFHDHGLSSLMAGGVARVFWLVPFTAIYLPLFDALKRQLTGEVIMEEH